MKGTVSSVGLCVPTVKSEAWPLTQFDYRVVGCMLLQNCRITIQIGGARTLVIGMFVL